MPSTLSAAELSHHGWAARRPSSRRLSPPFELFTLSKGQREVELQTGWQVSAKIQE